MFIVTHNEIFTSIIITKFDKNGHMPITYLSLAGVTFVILCNIMQRQCPLYN